MAKWTVKDKIPGGVIPKNAPAYLGLAVGGFLILVMMFTGSGQPEPVEVDFGDAGMEPEVGDVDSIASQVLADGERLREELERQAEAERLEAEEAVRREEAQDLEDFRQDLEEARAALVAARVFQERGAEGVMPEGEVRDAVLAELETVGELELREALRLEEIDRFSRSIRSSSVIGDVGAAAPPAVGGAPAAPVLTGNPEVDAQLMDLIRAEAAPGGAGGAPPVRRQSAPPVVVPPAQSPGGAARPAGVAPGGGAGGALGPAAGADLREVYTAEGDRVVPESTGGGTAAVARWAEVPDGMDLIYEGRMLQGTLVTQLTGDFTGPARALITVPVRSRDRRRVVIPVGTEVLGEARAVEGGFQGRLVVGFSRLVFPDGRSVRMNFDGLSSLGETGLADEVDRHYVSTLGAVGAVGLLAGLSASGGGGAQAYFDPAQQQFSLAAMRFLDRFMNRLPVVRIRAGHPVRVWLTQDLLVPRG